MKKGNFNNHDYIEEFEARIADYTGAPYCVAVNSCTNAILLSLLVQETGGKFPLDRDYPLVIPENTYLSVPMTLRNYGFKTHFAKNLWTESYGIGNTNVWDCAVGFKMDMYKEGTFQCLSFGHNKRLPIGRGGAILLDNRDHVTTLRRLRHDGRNSAIPVVHDIEDRIIMGHHMQMIPDEAVKGLLLLNNIQEYKPGKWCDYPDISQLGCFK